MVGKTRRAVLRAAAPAALLAAGCGQAATSGAGQPSAKVGAAPATVVAQITDTTPTMINSWATEMAAPFKQKFPNLTLELLPMPSGATLETFQKLTASMAAGTPPDIFDGPRYADWTVPQGFTDTTIDALVKRDKFDTKVFNQNEFTGAHTTQGKIAHIPYKFGGNLLGMLVNTALFQESGVALPPADVSKAWTADQFLQMAQKLTKTGADGSVAQFGTSLPGSAVYTWTLLWGTDWLADDVKTVTCDSAAMIAGYQWMQDLAHRQHVVPQPGEAARLFPGVSNIFMAGKQAMSWTATANYVALMNQARDANVKLTVVPAPALKYSTPDVNSHGLFLVKGGKHKDEGWEAIKFFSEKSRLATFAGAMTTILGDLEGAIREASKAHPAIDPHAVKQILESAKRGINLKRHIKQDDMLGIINPAITELNENKVGAADLMRRLKPQLQTLADQK